MSRPEEAATTRNLPWRVEDIDFALIDTSVVRDDERLFFLLASASFIESGASLYTRNLIDFYSDDPVATEWLADHWGQEELQHGRALRAYVEAVWPEYDWPTAFHGFFADYGAMCTADELEPTKALELAARCVVETGTATYYRMLYEAAREPVLRRILDNIRRDEVRHFKHFYRFFQIYRASEQTPRRRITAALLRRAFESTREDGYCAFRHAYAARYPQRSDSAVAYTKFRREVHRLARQHYPHRMAAEMFLKPLKLSPLSRRPTTWILARGLRFAL